MCPCNRCRNSTLLDKKLNRQNIQTLKPEKTLIYCWFYFLIAGAPATFTSHPWFIFTLSHFTLLSSYFNLMWVKVNYIVI